MKRPQESTIAICGIVRNAEKGLKRNIPIVDRLCGEFREAHVVVFENDSTDGTKQVLEDWHRRDPERVYTFTEDLGIRTIPLASSVSCNPFFSLSRNEKMSGFRNKYLDFVEAQGWNPDYLLVLDLDVVKIDFAGVMGSFSTKEDWDAITAFSHSLSPSLKRRYHDSYILVENGEESIPQTESSIKEKADKFAAYYGSHSLIPVYSAFGGLAIYKYEKVKGLRYKAIPNNDPRVESRGEHFSLYRQMRERGPIAVYVNPQMPLKYQSVDMQLVLKTVKRLFKK